MSKQRKIESLKVGYTERARYVNSSQFSITYVPTADIVPKSPNYQSFFINQNEIPRLKVHEEIEPFSKAELLALKDTLIKKQQQNIVVKSPKKLRDFVAESAKMREMMQNSERRCMSPIPRGRGKIEGRKILKHFQDI
ncbi:Hypothetical_protein [Hexamita inflata]|uniref:Hypothetical_protein n=1 Tax=Hexamita inflata TaxID=28002 RepID=A0AA86TY49_9EUKA|nr:Hypothetical protein HINF_LOCUS19067 [Hexamita inflata]CAI9973137.1 Hypothetical protein HINF_LOCUS60782 [Hexamita inflata]